MCSFVLIGFSKGRKQLMRKTSVSFVTSVVKRKMKRIYLIYLKIINATLMCYL